MGSQLKSALGRQMIIPLQDIPNYLPLGEQWLISAIEQEDTPNIWPLGR